MNSFWKSYSARVTGRVLARLFPDWFHEMMWNWGDQEALIRRELLEKAKCCDNAKVLTEITRKTHNLIMKMFNQRYGGLALEEYIPTPSVRSVSQLYTIMMVLFCFRINGRVAGLRKDLTAICRESHLVDSTWSMLSDQREDDLEQARRIWNECFQVLDGNDAARLSFFCNFFALIANRTADEIRERVN
jgi:hypothetical protein